MPWSCYLGGGFCRSYVSLQPKVERMPFWQERTYKTVKKFKVDYEHLILIPVNNNLNSVMEDLFNRHPLRGFDAIHLASALVFTNLEEIDPVFACYDHTLNKAAITEGLRIIQN